MTDQLNGQVYDPRRPISARQQYAWLRDQRRGLVNPVLDQIAFYAPNPAAVDRIKASLGLFHSEWVEDIVTGEARVWNGPPVESKAQLLFNYDLGIEVEILTYLEGAHWHDRNNSLAPPLTSQAPALPFDYSGFISHLGFHVNAGEIPRLPFPVAQELITHEHTNPGTQGRHYHYRIYDTRTINGTFLKYIKRLDGLGLEVE